MTHAATRIFLLCSALLLAGCGAGGTETHGDCTGLRPDGSVFTNACDGRLYAAAGASVITPDDQNHPCTKYLGGTSRDRIADGVCTDLRASALVLEQDGLPFVLVSLDLVGYLQGDVERILDLLEPRGIPRKNVVVASIHTHEGPDTIGIWGAGFSSSGRCPAYMDFLTQTVADLVLGLAASMQAVTVTAAETPINDAGSDHPALQQDFRYPEVLNNRLTAARFANTSGDTVATLVNWHTHPEAMITSSHYSADFPHWTREKLEERYGGVSVYFSGTVGGLSTPLDLSVPQYTIGGEPLTSDGEPVYVSENSEIKTFSLGYHLAYLVADLLDDAPTVEPKLSLAAEPLDIPVTNAMLDLMMAVGIISPLPLITDNPDYCGNYGCMRHMLQLLSIGTLHMVSLPGEVFPETSVGRPLVEKDWGEPWGVFTYPAMTGYRAALPSGHLLMEFGLANNEMGYVVPESDMQPSGHPNFYCEEQCYALTGEALLRQAVTDLLTRTLAPTP